MSGRGVNFTEVVARKKLAVGDDWLMFAWECVNDRRNADVIVTGGVPVGVYVRGPRKGRPKWDIKTAQRVVVTHQEELAAKHAYEIETGLCADCFGSRETWAGWNHETGNRYRPCARCAATGKAAATGESA